jgi:hypothetical protein
VRVKIVSQDVPSGLALARNNLESSGKGVITEGRKCPVVTGSGKKIEMED